MTAANAKPTVNTITVIGAGLVGSLLSIFLARRGFSVRLLERRPDMRKEQISAGRSINLAISERGINALRRLGLADEILAKAIPMKGRIMHGPTGDLTFQPYGTSESEYINSISRATLNKALMTHAEKTGMVQIHFSRRVTGVDFETDEIFVVDETSDRFDKLKSGVIIGTDGSASAVRTAMQKISGYQMHSSTLDYGYKELAILPNTDGSFRMERNALHIWPRGNYMLIALPNFEGSFTCTLFLPFSGNISFEHLNRPEAVEPFFKQHFPDAVPLVADLTETFLQNPMGMMTTVKCNRWHMGGKVLLMGDAAHGIVPFFGQGMNCGFEDCTIFDELLQKHMVGLTADWNAIFTEMTRTRVENTNAIADMAVENFAEMRDKVADKRFLIEKAVEKILQKRFPGRYVSRYALVTFSNVPYTLARDVGVICDEILQELCFSLAEPDAVDLQKAEKLIDDKLAPLLRPYAPQLQTVPAH
jgi:kynurenine 3-monooxygenase